MVMYKVTFLINTMGIDGKFTLFTDAISINTAIIKCHERASEVLNLKAIHILDAIIKEATEEERERYKRGKI